MKFFENSNKTLKSSNNLYNPKLYPKYKLKNRKYPKFYGCQKKKSKILLEYLNYISKF